MTEQNMAIRQEVGLTPEEVVDMAVEQSRLLMNIVEQTKCYQSIGGKKYLQVEAWETIGAFNRTHAEPESVTPIIRDGEIVGYLAHILLRKDGQVVGGAIMPCFFTENCCKGKEGDAKHKACMSAAQTFATSKAYRMNYSYVAILAGYQPLPAEEVTQDMVEPDKTQHWCKEHDTAFFMRGKMKAFAHPIGDNTGKWCHEHKTEVEQQPQNAPDASQNGREGHQGVKAEEIPAEVPVQFPHIGAFFQWCSKLIPPISRDKAKAIIGVQKETDLPKVNLAEAHQRVVDWLKEQGKGG